MTSRLRVLEEQGLGISRDSSDGVRAQQVWSVVSVLARASMQNLATTAKSTTYDSRIRQISKSVRSRIEVGRH